MEKKISNSWMHHFLRKLGFDYQKWCSPDNQITRIELIAAPSDKYEPPLLVLHTMLLMSSRFHLTDEKGWWLESRLNELESK